MTINERIFYLLETKNKKQSELAKHLNLSKTVITNWKNRGNNPTAEYIKPIADFLEVTIFELLGVENDTLTENQNEMLLHFNKLPEREQLKLIGKIEEIAEKYTEQKSLESKIG